jgi:hypothetical protein
MEKISMSVYNPIIKDLDLNEMKRYAGLSKAVNFPESMLREARDEILLLANPKSIWKLFDYDPTKGQILSPKSISLTGSKIIDHLSSCSKIAIIAVTVGSSIEALIQNSFKKGDYANALLIDAGATTLVEAAADALEIFIKQQAAAKGYATRFRFSPGYGDWSVTIQPTLLAAIQGQCIGIQTTESCMLIPRKSITAVIGWTTSTTINPVLPCNHCENCTTINCTLRASEPV